MSPLVNLKKRVLFLSFVGSNYSRSSTILNANSGKFQKEFQKLSPRFHKAFVDVYKQRKIMRTASCIVIMSPCHMLAPIVKILVRRPVVLDAGWALTDGQLSRGTNIVQLIRIFKIYLVDLLAFHFADLIFLESRAQVKRSKRNFIIAESKLHVSLTGLNENCFEKEDIKSELINEIDKKLSKLNNNLIVLFRGKVNNESGFEYICDAAQQLEKKVSFIFLLGNSDMWRTLPPNVVSISGISNNELKQIYGIADVAVGQISNHRRLRYTIPHKAFEAGYFAKPYISADNPGIREFLDTEDAVYINQPFTNGLVSAIQELSNLHSRKFYASQIRRKYKTKASQFTINQNFEFILENLINSRSNKGD